MDKAQTDRAREAGRRAGRRPSAAEPTKPPIRAVVFDLDDTLIATRRLYTEAYLRVLEPHHGRRLSLAELAGMRPGPETAFIPSAVGAEAAADSLQAFYDWYEALHPEAFDGLYPGVPEMLAALAAEGLRIGVFTGKSRRAWDISSRHVDLPGVAAWVFGDEIARHKPAPDGVLKALELLGVPAAETAYVGDSLLDIAAAEAAGVLPVAALWSRTDEDGDALAAAARAAGGVAVSEPWDLVARLSPLRSPPGG